MARALASFAAALAASVVFGAALPALAGPKEATKLDKQAMDDDYLNVRFDKAEEKLKKALKECDKGCDAKQKSTLYMHLGIILVNAGKKDDGVAAFVSGLKEDSGAAPEKDFTSPDVQKAYDEAKGKGGGKKPDDGDKGTDKPEPSSDLKHEAVAEGLVNAPLPIFVGAEASAAKFIVNYKPFGGEWTKVEMKKMGKIFGVEIPCKDTSATGTLKYYIVAQDAGGDTVATAGSKKQPYEVAIKNKVSGEQPSFPGKDAPAQCKSKDQCPPGINEPGCEATAALGFGSKCTGPGQCNKADGLACIEGTCQSGAEEGGGEAGEGGADEAPPKKNWLSLSLVLDDAIVGGGEVCTADNYTAGTYACFRDSGALYKPYEKKNIPVGGTTTPYTPDHGTVSGPPFAVGTLRALIGYDRLITGNLLLGIRVGYAFNGGPTVPSKDGDKTFLPFHVEPRATYFFGKNVLSKTGVRPYVFLGGGVGQVDAKIAGVPVSDDAPIQQKHIQVDAWRKMGTSFVALGGGIVYAVNKTTGLTVDIKVSQFFGSPGTAVSPSLGVIKGL